MIKKYGFIGLGDMGKPMVSNLLNSLKKIFVYDIDNLSNKAPSGSIVTNSIKELVANSEIIFISVPDGNAVKAVIDKILSSNFNMVKAIINLSTIGYSDTKTILEILSKSNIIYIDAPVSGGKSGAINGTITIMWSGSKKLLENIKDDLECFSKSIFFIGKDPGQGQIMKLLNNFLSAVAMTATSEAILLGLKNKIDMKTMLDVLNMSTGKNSATLDKFPNRILTETYDAAFKIALMHKDLQLYLTEAKNNKLPINIAEIVQEYFKEGENNFPSGDFTEIYKVINKTNI
jgi:3-hydroxyisobutyrate dehydrogenase-like beta-hydroxyacid dehydrogenase